MPKTSSRFARTSTNCRARSTSFTNVSQSLELSCQSTTATSILALMFLTSQTLRWQESTLEIWMVNHFLTALGASTEILISLNIKKRSTLGFVLKIKSSARSSPSIQKLLGHLILPNVPSCTQTARGEASAAAGTATAVR
jgi:hypothetical protein